MSAGRGGAKRPTSVAPRDVAFGVLRAVSERDAYANLVLPERLRASGLTGRDAAFVTELTYGTLRRSGTYDVILAACVDRPWERVDRPVQDVLRLGTHQLLSMEVPRHAAVNETVALASRELGRGRSGFVNAVLRRVGQRSWDEWMAELAPEASVDRIRALSLRHAHPEWIVHGLEKALASHGRPTAEIVALLDADNDPPQVTLVARPGRCEVAELEASGAVPGRWSPWAAVLPSGDPAAIPAVREQRAAVQDEGSQLVVAALAGAEVLDADAARREERWLDMCAGPGGKAGLLAALATERGATLEAWEVQPHRARLVEQAVGRHGTVRVVDAAAIERVTEAAGRYDRVLLDAPCTGLGALRRRPEARWRKTPDDVAALNDLQSRLLRNALQLVRPGGVVAYVTCSPLPAETQEVVQGVLPGAVETLDARPLIPGDVPHLGDSPDIQLWPHLHGTDAMYLCLLRPTVEPPDGASASVT